MEEKPNVTYNDVGGMKEQIKKLREVVEAPLLHPERFVNLGIDPPKGLLCICFFGFEKVKKFVKDFFCDIKFYAQLL